MAHKEADVYGLVLGRVIATLRERQGWTQAQLAQRVGLTQSTLSRIESGQAQPDAFTLRKLAEAFGMTVAEFHEKVDAALARTSSAAQGAAPSTADVPWWQTALKVAGFVGLAGLVAFAVAAALAEDDEA